MLIESELDTHHARAGGGVSSQWRVGAVFWISGGILVIVAFAAIAAPWLPLEDYRQTGVGDPRLRPFGTCVRRTEFTCGVLGTDSLGRDILSRVVHGARVSLAVGSMAIAMGLIIGGMLGVLAGYFRGRTDAVLMTMMDVFLAFPALVLALATVAFIADGHATMWHVTLALGILAIAPMCRVVRASTLAVTQGEFVLAAQVLGASHRRVLLREILPNVLPPALAFSLTAVAVAIVAEGGLAFLGLSVAPPAPTWGGMINDGRSMLRTDPHISLIPCMVLLLTVVAMNYVGDSLTARYDASIRN